ncbi:MAG: CotH kinase family protein [Gemmataceae bacterium]|nr:CotH kinase family protein [Gemmataceae bacterium]
MPLHGFRLVLPAAAVAGVFLLGPAPATTSAGPGVVINEVMYHPPDDRDDLQFVELHNPGTAAADLSGWKLKGAGYEFPAGTAVEAGGYLVVAKNGPEFKRVYGFDPAGEFKGVLGHGGEKLELVDAAGRPVGEVRYGTRAPWPVSPDGGSASLERVCPAAPGKDPENWAASPLPAGRPAPGGTPGKKNSVYSATPPPVVSNLAAAPAHPTPGQELKVTADVRAGGPLAAVELLYRVAGAGSETAEVAVPMTKGAGDSYAAVVPAQEAGRLVRFRVRAADAAGAVRVFPHPNDLRPAASAYVADRVEPGKIPLGFVVSGGQAEFRAAQAQVRPAFGRPPAPPPPVRGNSAFVYVGLKAAGPEVFDFVTLSPRTGGRKVRFHKDQPLGGVTTVNLVYEYQDRFPLAESLAYEVYRRAGVPCPRTDFVRTTVDGRVVGFELLVEQPNKAFLRRTGYDPGGSLYKANWLGNMLVQRHEKKSPAAGGHADLADLVGGLLKVRGDDQWAYIKKHFDAAEMASLYAVRTILSDWDGFFNNYYLHHDAAGSGKWVMFPWDQDKTWGFHDGLRPGQSFVDMPITYGMEGDRPPPGQGTFGTWWRRGGDLSRPLLANPTFRRHFLARTKQLLETVYTEEAFGPVIDALGERLADEVRVRAEARGEDPGRAAEVFRANLASLRDHLVKRRAFLLDQAEVKAAGQYDPAELK